MITVAGNKKFEARLNRLANWNRDDKKNMRKINRDAAKEYTKTAKGNIKSFYKDIVVQRGGSKLVVTKGQLKRSVGTWLPNKSGTWVAAGPRTNSLGRRNTSARSDGWFAHIVEGGDSFGRKKRTVNTGVFERSLNASINAVKTKRFSMLRREYNRWMK